MSWKLDNVLFSAYGVKVLRSSGLLDMPKMKNEGYNWLDLDGLDYRDAVGDLLYDDREVVLSCVIKAENFDTFLTAVEDFYEAIMAPGTRTLLSPYGTINNIIVQNGVEMVRMTSYLSAWQVGIFNLRLTVLGDSAYKSFPIYHASGSPVVGYLVTDNLQVRRTLQGESYATCTVELSAPLNVDMYAYILVNSNGVVAEPYYFMGLPNPTKKSSNKFVYNLRLDHGSVLLKQSQFLFAGKAEFDIYLDLSEIVSLICDNSDRFISGKFQAGTIESTVRKNHTFKGENCHEVLVRMAKEYDLEYDIRYTVGGGVFYTIDLKKQIATTKAVTLEYGKGNGLFELERQPVNRDKLVTVLYVYGAAKNLKPDYRGGKNRLEFDGNPLRKNDDLYMGVEGHVFLDEVYPQRTAEVESYTQVLKVEEDHEDYAAYAAIKDVWPGGMYRITDSTCFDINAFLRGGLTAKLRMKSGDLAGYEFEIAKYDNDTHEIFLIPFKDDTGLQLPNDTLLIASGDDYTLVDIDQPLSYVAVAEAELLARGQELLDLWSVPEYPYFAKVDPAYLSTILDRFDCGDRITVVDSQLSINQLYRISSLIFYACTGAYDLQLSENRILNRRERMEIDIDKINRTLEKTNADTVEVIRKDKETVTELRNRIFTPADDQQELDATVRNESIDPRMLAFDAGTVQFQILGCLVETPWQNDNNKIHIGAGGIEILNWPDDTLSRYDIWKLERDGGSYDPRRDWIMPDTVLTLPDNDGYYLIAKLPRDPAAAVGEWVASDFFIRTKADADYIQYTVGYINPAASPRTPAMLWGNVRVSPGQITAAIDPRLLGGGRVLYLHANASDIADHNKAIFDEPDESQTTYSQTGANTRTLLAQFISDSGMKTIPAGAWVFTTYCAVTADDEVSLEVEVYHRTSAGVETKLMEWGKALTWPVVAAMYYAIPLDQVVMAETDRIVVRYYAKFESLSDRTAYLEVEGNSAGYYWWSNVRIPGDGNEAGGMATVETDMSVSGDGSEESPVTLVNDEESPGNSQYYGTDAIGVKGFHDLPEPGGAITTDGSVVGTGDASDPVMLDGDEDSPGNSQYYGTDGTGTKGFHDLPEPGGGDTFPYSESFVATASQTNFTLENTPVCAWVWLAGAAQDAATWHISGDDIVLSTGATAGDVVKVYYLSNVNAMSSSGGEDTDEKVRYDETDPTAGYLKDKVVAGSNITIEEGTGADEHKVKINAIVSGNLSGRVETLDEWTLALTDANLFIRCNCETDITITIPNNSTVDFPIWTVISFEQMGAGRVTVSPDTNVTINTLDGRSTVGQYAGMQIIHVSTDVWTCIAGVT